MHILPNNIIPTPHILQIQINILRAHRAIDPTRRRNHIARMPPQRHLLNQVQIVTRPPPPAVLGARAHQRTRRQGARQIVKLLFRGPPAARVGHGVPRHEFRVEAEAAAGVERADERFEVGDGGADERPAELDLEEND